MLYHNHMSILTQPVNLIRIFVSITAEDRIITRLLFLEPSQLALIAEIISGVLMLMATSVEDVHGLDE